MIDLYAWFIERYEAMEGSDYIYKGAWSSQIMFVRDTLTFMLGARPQPTKPDGSPCPTVVVSGTHTSKSTELPVYLFDLPWGTVEMRDNYHDWNVSVTSKAGPIDWDASGLLHEGHAGYLFFQGMTTQHAAYSFEPSSAFSFCVADRYRLWAALFSIKRAAESTP